MEKSYCQIKQKTKKTIDKSKKQWYNANRIKGSKGKDMKKKQKKSLIRYCILLILVIITGTIGVASAPASNNTNQQTENRTVEIQEEPISEIQLIPNQLNILYLDVGQADSILIHNQGKTMLIDAGNNEDGEKLVAYIQSLGIQKIDYLIGTHAHEDHIGGLDTIINNFEIGTFYMPYDTRTTTQTYKDVIQAANSKNLKIQNPKVGDNLTLGEAQGTIMAIDNENPEEVNNTSIVLQLTYGTQKYLFMGDAESQVENSKQWEDIDVLKVGHHGSNTSSSVNFIKQTQPELAIISVGKGNTYNLPKQNIIERLESIGAKIYRTDESGTIYLTSDGTTNTIAKVKTDTDGNRNK